MMTVLIVELSLEGLVGGETPWTKLAQADDGRRMRFRAVITAQVPDKYLKTNHHLPTTSTLT